MKSKKPVPLFFNPESGSADILGSRLQNDTRVQLNAVLAKNLAAKVDQAVNEGTDRILIAGGDGTLALAASRLAGKKVALGILPAGTLNHFAQRVGIPSQIDQYMDVALSGKPSPVDVGYVNDHLFINTSSVGAYTSFVQHRNKLQKRLPYVMASIIAGLRRLKKFRKVHVTLYGKELHSPLVFIGVMERQLQLPFTGEIKKDGKRNLHLIAVETCNRAELIKLVFKSLFLGIDPLSRTFPLQTQMTDNITLRFNHQPRAVQVALDGELVWLKAPLQYRYGKDELLVCR